MGQAPCTEIRVPLPAGSWGGALGKVEGKERVSKSHRQPVKQNFNGERKQKYESE